MVTKLCLEMEIGSRDRDWILTIFFVSLGKRGSVKLKEKTLNKNDNKIKL